MSVFFWEKLPLRLRGFPENGFTSVNFNQSPNYENHFGRNGLYLWIQEYNPNTSVEIGIVFFFENLSYFINLELKNKYPNIEKELNS